jgi:outer membrane protein assembly factor BamD
MKHTHLLLFAFALLFSACSKFTRLQRSNDVQKKYAGALELYENKDYYKASLLLEEIIPVLRGTEQAEKAQLILAYCYYYQKDYTLSAFYFKRFYQTFGRSPKAEEAMYMHAYSLYKSSPEPNLDQSDTKKAISAFQSYLNAYPTSKRVDECNKLIKELRSKLEIKSYNLANEYYKQDLYEAAVIALSNFIEQYPDSDYREEAFYKRLESAYLFAKNSILSKQEQRYQEAIGYYQDFAERYPESKWLAKASNIYEKAVEGLRNAQQKMKELQKPQKEAEEDKAQPSF